MILTFYGKSESKKNQLGQNPVTKKRYNSKKVKDAINYFIQQIPPEAYDLKLEHPNVTYQFTVPFNSTGQDKDGLMTFVQDILKKVGVFRDDNIRWHNGHISIPPAILGDKDEYSCVVSINESS